jgi:hypothetical protein
MMTKKNTQSETGDFEDNSFQRAQEEARDGKQAATDKPSSKKKSTEEMKKAMDELMRAKEADKEWSSESDRFRRDNA